MLDNQETSYIPLEPKTIPGYFTGIYVGGESKVNIAKKDKLDQVAFANVLEKAYYEKNPNQIDLYVKTKVTRSSNGLPFVGALMAEVGSYGLVFASALRLCQYYKKVSPPPKHF